MDFPSSPGYPRELKGLLCMAGIINLTSSQLTLSLKIEREENHFNLGFALREKNRTNASGKRHNQILGSPLLRLLCCCFSIAYLNHFDSFRGKDGGRNFLNSPLSIVRLERSNQSRHASILIITSD